MGAERGLLRVQVVLGLVTMLMAGGCAERTFSLPIATLSDGNSILIREVRENGYVKKRELVCHCREGTEQVVQVDADEACDAALMPRGYDLLRSDDTMTLWRIVGTRDLALATITRSGEEPNSEVFGVPAREAHRKGDRVACRVTRSLASLPLPGSQSIRFFVTSVRDNEIPQRSHDIDSFWLEWESETHNGGRTNRRSVGTTIHSVTGGKCLPDPFNSQPTFDIRGTLNAERRGL